MKNTKKKLLIISPSSHGKFLKEAFRQWFYVDFINTSVDHIPFFVKYLSAAISFHLNRKFWKNDYERSPIMLRYLSTKVNEVIRRASINADVILQQRVTFPIDYSLLGEGKLFIYTDSVYNNDNKNWLSPRWGTYFGRMQEKTYAKTEKIFTHSQWAANKHVEILNIPENKIKVCGWGPCIDMPGRQPAPAKQARHFIFIGNDPYTKGLNLLIKAFDTLSKRFPDIILHLVGLNKVYKDITKNPQVFFHGYKQQDEFVELLSHADVMVHPTRFDTSGRAVVEAMGYGLPVIVSRVFGAFEPISNGHCGIVVSPENSDELMKAMAYFVENPSCFQQMAINAVKEARLNWSWDSVCQRMATEMIKCMSGEGQ